MAPGHPEAARLYDAYGSDLYRYAVMLLANREAAEDVIQQVFLAIVGGGATIHDEERYLRRAVRNGCYSVLRGRRLTNDDGILEAAAGAQPITPEDRIALSTALSGLPAEQREVVHLHVYEGRTLKEVAELTDESPNTVASRYRYALEKLRSTLTGQR